MNNENKISLVGTDGKIRWIEEGKVTDFLDKGWRVIVNPKEVYYPQYDQALNKPKEDAIGKTTKVLDTGFENVLGILVL